MQPESEGEFTWLWPRRKQEKGRSQINSPSFLPSSLSSGEGLSAKQKAAVLPCGLGSRASKQMHHVALGCICLVFTFIFPSLPTPGFCAMILSSASSRESSREPS